MFEIDKYERCLQECGRKCKQKIDQSEWGTPARSIYAFTCGDNPRHENRRCGLYKEGRHMRNVGIFGNGGPEQSIFKPLADSCSKVAKRELYASTKRAAILADYDGCWDIVSTTNRKGCGSPAYFKKEYSFANYIFATRILKNALRSIASGKIGTQISLLVGSLRQSVIMDRSNAERNGNGFAFSAFPDWKKYGIDNYAIEQHVRLDHLSHNESTQIESYSDMKDWNLEKALLADKQGSEWRDETAWIDRSKNFTHVSQEKDKLAIAENSVRF